MNAHACRVRRNVIGALLASRLVHASGMTDVLQNLSKYHPVVIEGMGHYDTREPAGVVSNIVGRLHAHWERKPPAAAPHGPIVVIQGDPLAEKGISAITRGVAEALGAPRALICLDEDIDPTHSRNADRHGVVLEAYYSDLKRLLAQGNTVGGGNGRNDAQVLDAAVEQALVRKSAARADEGKAPLKPYYKTYAMLQEVTKAAVRRLCGDITVVHTAADASPYSITSFFEVGLQIGLVMPRDMVSWSASNFQQSTKQ